MWLKWTEMWQNMIVESLISYETKNSAQPNLWISTYGTKGEEKHTPYIFIDIKLESTLM